MKKIISIIFFSVLALNADTFGIMILKETGLSAQIRQEVQSLANSTIKNFSGKHTIKVYYDSDSSFASEYKRTRRKKVSSFTSSNNLTTLNVIGIKKRTKLISNNLFLADASSAGEVKYIIKNYETQRIIDKIIISDTLNLIYELGVFNDKNIY